MGSTPDLEKDNWFRFDGDSTELEDGFEMDEDVDDLDIPEYTSEWDE